jgi:hypothetical protein
VVNHLEAEPVVVEGDRGCGVTDGKSRNRLAQRHVRTRDRRAHVRLRLRKVLDVDDRVVTHRQHLMAVVALGRALQVHLDDNALWALGDDPGQGPTALLDVPLQPGADLVAAAAGRRLVARPGEPGPGDLRVEHGDHAFEVVAAEGVAEPVGNRHASHRRSSL